MNIDEYLINKIDALTIKAQKRGIPLTFIHLSAAAASLLTNMGDQFIRGTSLPWQCSAAVVWGGWFLAYSKWEADNRDYYESASKMKRLNMEALRHRIHGLPIRYMWLAIMIWLCPFFIVSTIEGKILEFVTSLLSILSPTIMWYLNPCTFIGPGEFATKKNESRLHNLDTANGLN